MEKEIKKVCEHCGGTGESMTEIYNAERESMEQHYQKCLCQIEGTEEYNERIDTEIHERAGLVYSGKDMDGEDEWIGTDAQWFKYDELSEKLNKLG